MGEGIFFVCVRRAIFKGILVVVGRKQRMVWEVFVCKDLICLLN